MKRQIMGYGKDLMLVKIDFEKGAVGTMHTHPHTQSSMVVSGSFEVTIGGETRTLHGGDGYFVAPDVEHGVLCTEKGTLIRVYNASNGERIQVFRRGIDKASVTHLLLSKDENYLVCVTERQTIYVFQTSESGFVCFSLRS